MRFLSNKILQIEGWQAMENFEILKITRYLPW